MATAEDLQANASSLGAQALADSGVFLNDLKNAALETPSLTVPEVTQVLVDEGLLWDAMFRLTATAPAAPLVADYNFDAVTPPSYATLGTVTAPTALNIPELTLVEPTLAYPTAPTTVVPVSPGNSPEFYAPATPTKPTISLPAAPTFSPVALPDPASFDMPTLDATIPVDELTLTTSEFSYYEGAYSSALLDATKLKLLSDLQNGGYGIDTADEARLWERLRERELREVSAAVDDLGRQAAARGFALPPGADIARMDAARQAAGETISTASRDIAVKRADLYVQNRQFVFEQASKLEQILIGYHSAVAERALNAAKASVELGIAMFNARVAKFSAKLEAFKAAASVYESKVRGAMLAIEAFKSKVEAARLSVDVQKAYADVYRTQVEGAQALMGVYATEVQAAQVLANIERVKLEAFKAKVESYAAQVQARTAEFQVYEAQLRGEQTKVNLYSAQVQAYGQRVEAYKSRTQAEALVSKVQLDTNEQVLTKYRADLEGYKAVIAKVNAQLEGALRGYAGDIQKYAATSSATGKYYDLAVGLQEANSKIYSESSRLAIAKASTELEATLKLINLRLGALTSGAQVYGQNAAAALGAINSIAATIVQS